MKDYYKKEEIQPLIDFLEEAKKPPYKDSNLKSLLEWINSGASKVLEDFYKKNNRR